MKSTSSCPSGKEEFRSAAAARRFSRRLCSGKVSKGINRKVRYAYKCSLCESWHLSKSPPRKRAA